MTNDEWEIVKTIIQEGYNYTKGKRITSDEYREIINAVFHINKTGAPWQCPPHDFPPYTTASCHYAKFCRSGAFEKINDAARGLAKAGSDVKKMKPPVPPLQIHKALKACRRQRAMKPVLTAES